MRLFTDPHIGLNRRSHTTNKSRQLLKKRIVDMAITACHDNKEKGVKVACLGDLFDTFSNKEADIASGILVAEGCDYILEGNHDSLGIEGEVGSLHVIQEVFDDGRVVCRDSIEKITVTNKKIEGMSLTFVPHHLTQEIFDKAIKEACNYSGRAVFLHCNYNNGFAKEVDTSLNLTPEQADELLDNYDYVILGHEHSCSEHLFGRLVFLGNTFPTGFGDISDKYYWDLTNESFTRTPIWEKSKGYKELDFNKIADVRNPELSINVEFVEVTGEVTPEQGVEVAKLVNALWENYPNLKMVRNKVDIKSSNETFYEEGLDLDDLVSVITKKLKGTKFYELWNKYSKGLK